MDEHQRAEPLRRRPERLVLGLVQRVGADAVRDDAAEQALAHRALQLGRCGLAPVLHGQVAEAPEVRGVLVAEIDHAVVLHLDDLLARSSADPVVEGGRRWGGKRHVEPVRLHVAQLALGVGELHRPVLLRHFRVVACEETGGKNPSKLSACWGRLSRSLAASASAAGM